MKKMFYRTIKIFLSLLISISLFQQAVLCDETQESVLIANLASAKNEKQQKKANFKLLEYYMNTEDYESAAVIGNDLLKFKLSKKQK